MAVQNRWKIEPETFDAEFATEYRTRRRKMAVRRESIINPKTRRDWLAEKGRLFAGGWTVHNPERDCYEAISLFLVASIPRGLAYEWALVGRQDRWLRCRCYTRGRRMVV